MLPDEYGENEVKNVLEKLGNPAILANQYQDRPMYLIGPAYLHGIHVIIKNDHPDCCYGVFYFSIG